MKSLATASLILALLVSAGVVFAQPTSFNDDFSKGNPKWHAFAGKWNVTGGEFIQSGEDFDLGAALDYPAPSKYRLSVKVRSNGKFIGGGLAFNMASLDSRNTSQMVRFDTDSVSYGYFDQNGDFQYQGGVKVAISTGNWFKLAVVVDNEVGKYTIYFNDKPVKENLALTYAKGYVGLQSSGGSHSFDDFSLEQPTKTELAEIKPDYPFGMGRGIAVDKKGNIYVSQSIGDTIAVVSRDGKRIGGFGKHGDGKYETVDPTALTFDASGKILYVLDKDGKKVVEFTTSGKPVKEILLTNLVHPTDISLDALGNVFIVDSEKCCVAVYDPSGNLRTTFGTKGIEHGQFDGPRCIAIDKTNRILVGDQTWYKCRVEILSFDPKTYKITYSDTAPYTWEYTDIVITPENKIASYGALDLWNNCGTVRLLESNFIPRGNFTGFSVEPMGRHGALALGPKNWLYLLDSDQQRVYVIPPDLKEPRPNVEVKPGEATITWESNINGQSKLKFRDEKSEGSNWIEVKSSNAGTKHTATLSTLQDAKHYDYHIAPTVETIPATDSSKEYRFLSSPGKGKTALVHMDIVVAIYLSTDIDGKTQVDIPMDKLGTKVQTEFEKARLFWLRNSLFKFSVTFKDYVIITDKRLMVKDKWVEPDEVKKDLRPILAAQGKNLDDYDSVIALYAQPTYDASKPDWLGWTNGSGLTPFGYSIMGIGGTQNWLFVHEFDHQVDTFFNNSGFPEYWFDHPDTTINPGYFGGQFDVNAHIWRTFPRNDWFWCRYGKVMICDDQDEDGIPDNDPRLPLDEARFGSDPTKVDTDNDGFTDLQEIDAGIFTPSNPRNQDTDGDGIIDGKDTYPIYPINPIIPQKDVTIDGKISDGEWTHLMAAKGPYIGGQTYLNWKDGYVEFAAVMDKPFNLILDVDADADGWHSWSGNYEVRVTANKPGEPCVAKGADGIEAKSTVVDGKTVLEVRIPVTSKRYKLVKGQQMSFRIAFETPDGVQHLFDPWEMPRLTRN